MQNSGEDKANDYDGTLGSDSGGEAVLKAGAGITVGGQAVELSRGSAPNGGYISAPNAAFQAAGNSLTISMWLKLTDNPTWNHIFSMGTDKNHYALLATVGNPYGTPVGLTMGINNGSGEYRMAAAPADTVLPGDWAMVTYCQDEQGRAAFYLNGQLVESTRCYYADMTEKGDGTIPVGFGDVAGSNNSGGVYFGKNAIFADPATDGLIGEIRVYDDVLSGDAIAALYDAAMDSLEEMAFQDAVETVRGFDKREITKTIELPTEGGSGCDIAWTVASGHAEIRDNVLYKTEGAAENEPITLTATMSYGEESGSVLVDDLVLKDAYVGQVMSYFTNRDDTCGLKLAYTYDLKNFMPLNGGQAVVARTVGSNRMRDPSIFRKKDGTFGVSNTNDWDSPYIGLMDSVDLCTFTNERLVPTGFNDGQASHVRSWVPEINYDRVTGFYYVYWSDYGNDHPCYYNTTPDLEADTFSDAGVYFDIGINIIDSSIKWENGQYHLVYKLENGSGAGYGTLLMAHSDTLAPGSWETSLHPIGGTNAGYPQSEGPNWAKSYADGKYYIYTDEFTGGVTYYTSSPSAIRRCYKRSKNPHCHLAVRILYAPVGAAL